MKKVSAFIASLAALALEITPYGTVLHFANPEGEPFRKTYSYFSMMPCGYGNVFPLMTGIVTVLLVASLLYAMIRKSEKAKTTAFLLSLVGAILSLLPLVYSVRSFSLVGGGITLCLAASTLLLFQKDSLK